VPVYIWSVVLLGTATCVAAVALVPARPTAERELSGWLLALMFFATASYVANFPYGRHVHSFQLCDVPRLLGLLFASPAVLILARLLGALPALVLVRRQVDRKLLFNLGSFALEVSTAILVFAALAPQTAGIGPSMWPALFAATAAADLVSSVSVGLAIALSEGGRLRDRLVGPARIAILTSFAASILGLTVATTYYYSPGAAALLAVLVVLAMVASRSYGGVTERNQAAVRLQTLLSELGPVTVDAPQLPRLLGMVRELFRVECVHLVRTQADGQQVRSACADGVVAADRLLDEAETTLLSQVMASGQASADAPLHRFRLPSRRATRLVAPLPGRQGALGGLVLSEPLGDVRQFSALDLRLLGSVSTQLGQAVDRGEELGRLEWAASHDPTTGLLNLQAWRTQLAQRLEQSPDQLVLSIDIARLRVINDVFGRATGDLMLVALADRLQAGRPGVLAGRVGGHHFALLAPQPAGSSPAAVAREIRDALQQPIDLHGLNLQLGVRIGVAVTPQHGADPEVLLRRAEAALDAAKSDTSDLAVFTPDMEGDSERSLRLLSDLRTALSGGDGRRRAAAGLPAEGRPGDPTDVRRRGADPLGPPHARPRTAGRVRARRGGDGAHQPAHRLGAAAGPVGLRGVADGRPRHHGGGEPVRPQPARPGAGASGAGRARRRRAATRGAGAGADGDQRHGAAGAQHRGAAGPARPGGGAVDRRLRNRVLVAGLPAAAARRRGQAGPQLPGAAERCFAAGGRQGGVTGAGHHPAVSQPRPPRARGGSGGPADVGQAGRSGGGRGAGVVHGATGRHC
jgi:diguanylate cyclase (GGDEF)-like protein